jgi:hypothetical protein
MRDSSRIAAYGFSEGWYGLSAQTERPPFFGWPSGVVRDERPR